MDDLSYSDISPRYIMVLVPKIEEELWGMFERERYQNVLRYIVKWHEVLETGWGNTQEENFSIRFKKDDSSKIDLADTLHGMPKDLLIKIAIDLGIDTPGFLPAIPTFKNILKDANQSAFLNFERAVKNVYENPDQAVALASSTLEGLIKTIRIEIGTVTPTDVSQNKALSKLVAAIVSEFGFNDKTKCPQELITIASQLRSLGATIDDLRSDKSTAHGKAHDEYIVDDPLWASLVVNTSATLGLFLWEYFEKKYKPAKAMEKKSNIVIVDDDIPVNLDEIPF